MKNDNKKHHNKGKNRGSKIIIFFLGYVIVLGSFIFLTSTNLRSIEFDKDYEGMNFRYHHMGNWEENTVTFKGRFSDPLIGPSKFVGKLMMGEFTYDLDLKIKPFEPINLYDANGSSVGKLFTDSKLDKITILINEKIVGAKIIKNETTGVLEMTVVEPVDNKADLGQLIFSGPAVTIDEALEISKTNIGQIYDYIWDK